MYFWSDLTFIPSGRKREFDLFVRIKREKRTFSISAVSVRHRSAVEIPSSDMTAGSRPRPMDGPVSSHASLPGCNSSHKPKPTPVLPSPAAPLHAAPLPAWSRRPRTPYGTACSDKHKIMYVEKDQYVVVLCFYCSFVLTRNI